MPFFNDLQVLVFTNSRLLL